MPRESVRTGNSKRAGKPLQIPAIGTNPQERKRQLNVLAQRNYRKRKREYLQRLEAQLEGNPKIAEYQTERIGTEHVGWKGKASDLLVSQPPGWDSRITNDESVTKSVNLAPIRPPSGLRDAYIIPEDENDPPLLRWEDDTDNVDNGNVKTWSQSSPLQLENFVDTTDSLKDHTSLSSLNDETYFSEFIASTSPRIPSPKELSRSTTPLFSFPDEHCLPVFELSLLRGSLVIAQCLDISPDLIWDPTALSPFADPANSHRSFDHLPIQFRPTPAQRRYPHHPMLDLLPWAVARSKIVMMFTQPASVRPPAARSETALMDMLYDADDGAEGMKVWGADPLDPQNWELGEKVWRRWWWAFDKNIVTQSNSWRHARGAPLLGRGQVLEEIS